MRWIAGVLLVVACGGESDGSDASVPFDAAHVDDGGIDSAVDPEDAGANLDSATEFIDAEGIDAEPTDATSPDAGSRSGSCPDPIPDDWIFCDDFERGDPSADDYFERNFNGGSFQRTSSQAFSGEHSMEVFFDSGAVEAGNLKVAFGEGPVGSARHRPGVRFDEIYWRMRVLHQEGWIGNPAKLSRATMFVASDWSQGMIAHIWEGSGDLLKGDPVSCIAGGSPVCRGYNDFANMRWMGGVPGETPVFAPTHTGRWTCVEAHVRLNTPGSSDGVFEFWVDDNLESARTDFDWRGTYTDHGLNAVMFENYWNAGSPQPQYRWFDDLVIAESRVGCEG